MVGQSRTKFREGGGGVKGPVLDPPPRGSTAKFRTFTVPGKFVHSNPHPVSQTGNLCTAHQLPVSKARSLCAAFALPVN